MTKTKKERRMSKKFSRIKKELKRQGLDVKKVKKSQKTYSSIEEIRKDILSQIEMNSRKEDSSIKEGEELVDKLQATLGRTFNTKADDKPQVDKNNQTSVSVNDPIVPYSVLKRLDRARDEDGDGYPMIYNFYEALGLDINNAESETVRKSDIEAIADDEIRNWALQAFQAEYAEDIAEANKEED